MTITLSYFDFNGGRGEPARLAMILGDIDFNDDRIPMAKWPEARATKPFKAIPTLEVDGEVFTQSNAINRYVAKLAKLYPTDQLEAFRCDEVMDAIEDQSQKIVATFSIQDPEEKKRAREKLADGLIPNLLSWLNDKLKARGEYFADNRLTIADLRVFATIKHLKSGNLDHIPSDLCEKVAPLVEAHYQRIINHPKLAGRYA